MPSPLFSINGGAAGAKASVAAGAAVTAILDSIDGVRTVEWAIIRTDETSATTDYALVQSGAVGQQVDTTALTAGKSAALQCRINGGIDPSTGNPSAAMTSVAKFYVPTADGNFEVLNAGEFGDDNTESSATHGAVDPVNSFIRGIAGAFGSIDWKSSVLAATTGALPANTRTGNTLTADANGAFPAQDGVAVGVNDRLLVKNEALGENNGIFYLADAGSGATPWILTRSALADESDEVTTGLTVRVEEGTAQQKQVWVLTTVMDIVLNTTPLVFEYAGSIDLVTTTADGTVTSLGAADTVFVTDGATAGGGWAKIVNANVNAAAAIACTKTDGDFGAVNISTTGTMTAAVVLRTADGVHNVETLGAAKVLVTTSAHWQRLNPNGADRFVDLPAEASSTGLAFKIHNSGSGAAAGRLVVRDDGGTTIVVLHPGQSSELVCDGTTWIAMRTTQVGYNVTAVQNLAGGDYNASVGELVRVDPSGVTGNDILLPTAVGNDGLAVTVWNDTADLNVIDIGVQVIGELINGAATASFSGAYNQATFVSNGVDWRMAPSA